MLIDDSNAKRVYSACSDPARRKADPVACPFQPVSNRAQGLFRGQTARQAYQCYSPLTLCQFRFTRGIVIKTIGDAQRRLEAQPAAEWFLMRLAALLQLTCIL